jgi:hypothetical protein
MSVQIPPCVADLLARCPFLGAALRESMQLDDDDFELATVVYGGTARLLMENRLSAAHVEAVFGWFNDLAERGDADEVLGTGAIELFNDDAASQRLGRAELKGRALRMLEEFRLAWGQPVYDDLK